MIPSAYSCIEGKTIELHSFFQLLTCYSLAVLERRETESSQDKYREEKCGISYLFPDSFLFLFIL